MNKFTFRREGFDVRLAMPSYNGKKALLLDSRKNE